MNIKLFIKRFLAFAIDWCIAFGVGMAFMLYGPGVKSEYALRPSIEMFKSMGFIIGICWIVLYCLLKDCIFSKRSLGKLICGLKVTNRGFSDAPSYTSLILRNVTFVFVQIELIIVLINRGIRVGDIIAKTEVVLSKS